MDVAPSVALVEDVGEQNNQAVPLPRVFEFLCPNLLQGRERLGTVGCQPNQISRELSLRSSLYSAEHPPPDFLGRCYAVASTLRNPESSSVDRGGPVMSGLGSARGTFPCIAGGAAPFNSAFCWIILTDSNLRINVARRGERGRVWVDDTLGRSFSSQSYNQ
eukprot:jgi/Botrbrau1/12996/Bobra.384_1s0020.1